MWIFSSDDRVLGLMVLRGKTAPLLEDEDSSQNKGSFSPFFVGEGEGPLFWLLLGLTEREKPSVCHPSRLEEQTAVSLTVPSRPDAEDLVGSTADGLH